MWINIINSIIVNTEDILYITPSVIEFKNGKKVNVTLDLQIVLNILNNEFVFENNEEEKFETEIVYEEALRQPKTESYVQQKTNEEELQQPKTDEEWENLVDKMNCCKGPKEALQKGYTKILYEMLQSGETKDHIVEQYLVKFLDTSDEEVVEDVLNLFQGIPSSNLFIALLGKGNANVPIINKWLESHGQKPLPVNTFSISY